MKCLLVGEKPGVVDGGWSNWSPWTRCSRTCGSGVTLSVRRCVNPVPSNGGAFCRGDRKRHKICATEVSSPSLTVNFAKNLTRNWTSQGSVRYFVSCENEKKDECLVMDGYRTSIDFEIVSDGEMKVNNCDYNCATENRQNWWCWIVKWSIISCEIIWNSKNGRLKRVVNVVILGGRIIYERFDDNSGNKVTYRIVRVLSEKCYVYFFFKSFVIVCVYEREEITIFFHRINLIKRSRIEKDWCTPNKRLLSA